MRRASPTTFFIFFLPSLGCLLVEFWWCWSSQVVVWNPGDPKAAWASHDRRFKILWKDPKRTFVVVKEKKKPPFGAPSGLHQDTPDPNSCPKLDWPKAGHNHDGQPWIGKNWPNQDGKNGIGQSRSLPPENLPRRIGAGGRGEGGKGEGEEGCCKNLNPQH